MDQPTRKPFQHPDNPADITVACPEPDSATSPRTEPPALTFHFPDSTRDAGQPDGGDSPPVPRRRDRARSRQG
jgi:hypothetical protein